MKIENYRYYAIVCVKRNEIISWFNNRVYLGRYVMSAYNQIRDKERYKIVQVDNFI